MVNGLLLLCYMMLQLWYAFYLTSHSFFSVLVHWNEVFVFLFFLNNHWNEVDYYGFCFAIGFLWKLHEVLCLACLWTCLLTWMISFVLIVNHLFLLEIITMALYSMNAFRCFWLYMRKIYI